MTSRKVWALGAFFFSSMAIVANKMIWTVAPLAYLDNVNTFRFHVGLTYQNGPDTPYR